MSHKSEHNSDQNAEPYDEVYTMRVKFGGPVDPELAASLQKVFDASDRDPDSWQNNPEKKKAALEGWERFFDEWEAENGAFTEEELAEAHPALYGEIT